MKPTTAMIIVANQTIVGLVYVDRVLHDTPTEARTLAQQLYPTERGYAHLQWGDQRLLCPSIGWIDAPPPSILMAAAYCWQELGAA